MAAARKPAPRVAIRKAKAADGDWVALYDENGKLIGITDPANITPISDASGPAPDLTPAPAAEVGVPADGVTKQARRPASSATAGQEAMAKTAQITALRKGLNAPRLAADNDRHAAAMGEAAAKVLAEILARQSGGSPFGRRR